MSLVARGTAVQGLERGVSRPGPSGMVRRHLRDGGVGLRTGGVGSSRRSAPVRRGLGDRPFAHARGRDDLCSTRARPVRVDFPDGFYSEGADPVSPRARSISTACRSAGDQLGRNARRRQSRGRTVVARAFSGPRYHPVRDLLRRCRNHRRARTDAGSGWRRRWPGKSSCSAERGPCPKRLSGPKSRAPSLMPSARILSERRASISTRGSSNITGIARGGRRPCPRQGLP